MKHYLLHMCCALFVALSLPFAAPAADKALAKDFAAQVKITSQFELGEATLTDFPVLVRLSEAAISGFSYSDFQQANGGDLRFMDATGRTLSHEIQHWDPTGESLVWVKLPTLTADTSFYALYGTALPVPNTPADTWSAYAGVWHFDEGVQGGTSYDATANHFDGDNADGITDADGVIGRAREIAMRGILLPTTTDLVLGNQFSFSGWVYHNNGGVSWDHLFYRKNNSGDSAGFASELNSSNLNKLDVYGDNNNKRTLTTGLTVEAWHHVTLSYGEPNAEVVCFYNNGALMHREQLTYHGPKHASLPIAFGTDSDRNDGSIWHGRFDEFRMRTVAPTAEWVAAEYATMASPASLSYGAATSEKNLFIDDSVTVSWDSATGFSLNASLASGSADFFAILPDLPRTNTLALAATEGTPYSVALTDLADHATYAYSVLATNAAGEVQTAVGPDSSTFYTGEPSVQRLVNGAYDIGRPAAFSISRASSPEATRHDLTLYYSLSGTAIPGSDYPAQSGRLIIPAGQASTLLQIPVLESVSDGATLTLTLLPGPYALGDSSAASASLYTSAAAHTEYTTTDFAHQVTLRSNVDLQGGTLENFPVLVRLGSHISGFSYDDVRLPHGADLCFFDAQGSVLPYEVQLWNPNGESLVWVLAPTFGKDTLLTLCYGRDTAVDNAPYEVWNDFAGVWHFDSADATNISPDSTANFLHADLGAAVIEAEGVVGPSRSMETVGESGDRGILILGSESLQMLPNFTVSGWVYHAGTTSWDHLFYRKNKSGDGRGWASEINDNNLGTIRIYGQNNQAFDSATGLANDTWSYISLVYTGRNVTFYNNGILVGQGSFGSNLQEGDLPITFGINSARNDSPWHGRFDECRVRLDATQADLRASADYQIMASLDALSYGEVSAAGAPTFAGIPTLHHIGTRSFALSAEMTSGVGDLFIVCNNTLTNALSGGTVSGAHLYEEIPILGLTPDTTYTAALVATNAAGAIVRIDNENAFFTGTLSAEVTTHAQGIHIYDGIFTIRRPDTPAACQHPLTVHYSLSGTAIPGTDYEAPASNTLILPAGTASIDLPIHVLSSVTPGVSLTLTLTDGLYDTDATSIATMDFSDLNLLELHATRLPITIQGYPEDAAPLLDFPVLVRLNPSTIPGFTYSTFRNRQEGTDLIFATPEGRTIPHEIDTWNPTGESLIWVKVPEVAAGTTFYAYYGAETNQTQLLHQKTPSADTWSDYIGVWHLNEPGDAGAPVYDSTAHALDGVSGPYAAAVPEGIIGASRRISNGGGNGSEKGNITVPYKPALDVITTFYTASWWCYGNSVTGWAYFIGRKAQDSSNAWGLQLENNAKFLRFWYAGGGNKGVELNSTLQTDRWYKMTAVYDGSGTRYGSVYIDGELCGKAQVWNWPNNGTDNLYIGGMGTGYGTFHGIMDEVRLRPTIVSDTWVRAEYQQETDPSWLSYGPAEPLQPATLILFR